MSVILTFRFSDAISDEMNLSGTINAGETWIVTNSDTNSTNEFGYIMVELYNMADQWAPVYPSPLYMNGNDAMTLSKNGSIIDIIGKIGEDPGDAWTDDATAGFTDANGGAWWTKNHTLIRKASVKSGVTTNPILFNPASEWDSLSINTWTNLAHMNAIVLLEVHLQLKINQLLLFFILIQRQTNKLLM